MEITESLKVPPDIAGHIWESCRFKPIAKEVDDDMTGLDEYTPSFGEFSNFIDKANPRSTGGFNGLNYLMVQHLPDELKKRIYDILLESWKTRTPIDGWGDRWLVPIPKITDPSLGDLRPIMLVDVLRKIWVGLLMDKIRQMWDKWGLINEAQHGFMSGKGTHTAIPHLISLFETARHNKSCLYLSSWDITRAFDSLGRETVIMAMLRLHVPRRLAEYITGMDRLGHVYVRTPKNYEDHNWGGERDLTPSRGFKTLKGVGQGDIPSPLLWAAAFDTLLCALAFLNSNFSILDLGYNAHMVADICYADDLISAVCSLLDLQAKADIVSGWCLIMGVKISHAKFRTFGLDWGVKRKTSGNLIVHKEGWTEVLVDVRSDGVLTHLGMVWNTDLKNKELWGTITERLEDLGWRIARTWVRQGDKMLAMNYCLRADICYRLQFANWSLEKYKKLDEIYIRTVRRITKNMTSYPALPIMIGKQDGGLGVETPMMHSHKCKLRILLRGLGKGGLTAAHLENLLRIEMEKAGNSGLPNQDTNVMVSYGDTGYLTSLIQWLDEVGLAIHLPGLIYNSPLSLWVKFREPKGRRPGKPECYRMAGEFNGWELEGKKIPVRIGQHWEIKGGLFEITSLSDHRAEGLRWMGQSNRPRKDATLKLVEGEMEGAGSGGSIPIRELLKAGRLGIVEKGSMRVKDKVKKVSQMLRRTPEIPRPSNPPFIGSWGVFEGFEFDTVYTDGSWKESCSLREFLGGISDIKAGGAIVLAKGDKFLCIRIEMDVETESAFDTEMISLLIAIDICGGKDVTIYSD